MFLHVFYTSYLPKVKYEDYMYILTTCGKLPCFWKWKYHLWLILFWTEIEFYPHSPIEKSINNLIRVGKMIKHLALHYIYSKINVCKWHVYAPRDTGCLKIAPRKSELSQFFPLRTGKWWRCVELIELGLTHLSSTHQRFYYQYSSSLFKYQ